MFDSWYKHGVGKNWFKNLEYSLCITLRKNWNTKLLFQETAFENVVCKMPTILSGPYCVLTLQWRHNGCDSVPNQRRLDCLLNRLLSGVDQRKHQNSASLAFVRRIHWWPMNSPRKGPVTRKMLPFDYVIMKGDGGAIDNNLIEWK